MAKLSTKEKEIQGRRVKQLVRQALGEGYTFHYDGGSNTRNTDGYLDLETITYRSADRSKGVTIHIYGDDLLNPVIGNRHRYNL